MPFKNIVRVSCRHGIPIYCWSIKHIFKVFSCLIINILLIIFLASWKINHVHRIKRHVSHNNTSSNVTKARNVTTTGVPTVATTLRRRPVFGWPARRRNTPRPTGRPTLNLTGLTDVQKEKMLRGNRSAVPLDHLGFPVIPNSHRGTRRPLPLTQGNASRPTPNSGKGVNGKPRPYGIMGEFREPENKTQTSTLSVSNTTISTDSEHSNKTPHTEGPQKNTRHDNKRDMPTVISKHGIWIAVVASLLLSAFICLTVHWVRQRRRGKLIIAPVSNNGQRSAAVVFKAWDRSSFQHRIPNRKSSELSHV